MVSIWPSLTHVPLEVNIGSDNGLAPNWRQAII